jgi:hypothetical protein
MYADIIESAWLMHRERKKKKEEERRRKTRHGTDKSVIAKDQKRK